MWSVLYLVKIQFQRQNFATDFAKIKMVKIQSKNQNKSFIHLFAYVKGHKMVV